MPSRVRTFLSYYRPYRHILSLDLLCALVVSGVTLAFPLAAGYVTRIVLRDPAPHAATELMRVAGILLALMALHAAANTFVDYRGHVMGTLIERDMRRDLFRHLLSQPFSFFDRERTGQLMSRVTHDLYAVGELAHHGPEDLLIATLKFGGVFLILLTINPALTLLLFAFVPFMALYALVCHRHLHRAMLRAAARIGDVNAQVEDSLSGIRAVQSFTGERAELHRFDTANALFVRSREDGYRAEAYFYQGMTAFTQLMTVAVLILGGLSILRGDLALDELVTYLLCVGLLIEPIGRFVNISRLLQEGLSGFIRVRELMDVEPELRDAPGARELSRVRGDVRLEGVSFAYPHGREVLHDLDLHIRPGEFVALVGASGVGKSTLCQLIPRFHDVTKGQVLIDDTPVREVTLESLRRQIGVVQQDVYLFAASVRDNLRLGDVNATDAQIEAAARQAGAHEFITQLPRGYDTQVGQRGVRLSGGQRQRLSLARVFLKDPPVLILDEATSALDVESEARVQQALVRLARNRTTIVIAHRLSTVRQAQRIVVLTERGIAEQGTHEELLRSGGVYARWHEVTPHV
ncbi:ABC transporter ATP-binding protein [Deinococcus pimensis]|uniref:ABC transporter ATP-binding protein n=1 Tax=Deinococcus pimensis TaxID=309888 RepID=UPI0004B69558|nr:ABC transporter ATP-binding protein [Deinococcus pimensis]